MSACIHKVGLTTCGYPHRDGIHWFPTLPGYHEFEGEPDIPLGFVEALQIANSVLDQYKTERYKWWKRMDGSPVLNDIAVRMGEKFSARLGTFALWGERTVCFNCGHDKKFKLVPLCEDCFKELDDSK